MKTILVEDNETIKKVFLGLIEKHCPFIDIIGIASTVESGVALINQKKPELIFLDNEMPDGFGFDILKQIVDRDFQVIFITAHEKYALQAIKYSALDYLLKPIDPEELIEAANKAQAELDQQHHQKKIDVLIENLSMKGELPPKIVVKDKYGIQLIATNKIIRLEGDGSYTTLHIVGEKAVFSSRSLKEYENLLTSPKFFRCHQSHIINLDFMSRYDRKEGDQLFLEDGSKVPLAVRKKERLMNRLKLLE